jgi:hyperosmotically inducible periplasmic protein
MKTIFAVVLASLSLISLQSFGAAARKSDTFEGGVKDAWIMGKIETVYTLNKHLNPFSIDTDVENGIVHLTGMVESDIDRDLAGELAKGIEGVVEVKNDLKVGPPEHAGGAGSASAGSPREDRSFGAWVDDATTTAAVKSKLIGNPNTKGMKIDVDTRGDVVTLSGRVASAEEKQLAEEIARNTGDVKDVRNQLVVDPVTH